MDNHSLFQQIPARLDQLEKDMQIIIKNQSNILAILQKLTHHDIHDIPEDFPVNTVEELDKLDKQISKDVPKYYKIIAKIIRGDLAKNLDGILGPDLIMMLNYDGILGKMPFKQYFNVNNALLNAVKEEGMSSRVYVQLIRTAFKANKGRIAKRKFDSKAKELKRKDDDKDYTDMDNGNKENEADFANFNVQAVLTCKFFGIIGIVTNQSTLRSFLTPKVSRIGISLGKVTQEAPPGDQQIDCTYLIFT
ncbi:hypothetical protein ACLKA6_012677 [Drosophila palustris]